MEAGQLVLILTDSCKLQHFGGNQENPHTAGSDLGKGEGKQDQGQTAPGEFCSKEFQRGPWAWPQDAVMHCPVQLSKNALIPSGQGWKHRKTEEHLSSETGNEGISSPLSTQLLIQAETAEGLKSEIYEKLQM